LEQSEKYVPTYELINRIKQKETAIREEALEAERKLRRKVEAEKEEERRLRKQERITVVNNLHRSQMPVEQIASILGITVEEVEAALKEREG